MQAIPDITNDSISAGPVLSCAATPVRTKMPVPMMAPIPIAVRETGPSTRRRRCSPAISSRSSLSGFFANSWLAMRSPPGAPGASAGGLSHDGAEIRRLARRSDGARRADGAQRPETPAGLLEVGHLLRPADADLGPAVGG